MWRCRPLAHHSILGMGCYINFVTNATGFDDLYPGLDVRFLTLSSNMLVPLHREWGLVLGVGVASPECIKHCLSHGRSVGLVGACAPSFPDRTGVVSMRLLCMRL